MKKRFKVTTKANPKKTPAPDLLKQDFNIAEPNSRWVADFIYVDTREDWLYVAAVMDLFSICSKPTFLWYVSPMVFEKHQQNVVGGFYS